jgi:predicted RNase H-like HicB family nuclease
MSYKTNVLITKEDNWYVASSIETNVTSQGHTIEEALENLKEALELYYENNSNINDLSNV